MFVYYKMYIIECTRTDIFTKNVTVTPPKYFYKAEYGTFLKLVPQFLFIDVNFIRL